MSKTTASIAGSCVAGDSVAGDSVPLTAASSSGGSGHGSGGCSVGRYLSVDGKLAEQQGLRVLVRLEVDVAGVELPVDLLDLVEQLLSARLVPRHRGVPRRLLVVGGGGPALPAVALGGGLLLLVPVPLKFVETRSLCRHGSPCRP